jgi:hypothetical protein
VIERGIGEEIIQKIDITKIKDHLEIITIIVDKMIDIIKGSLEQYIMSNSLIDKIKILEEDKEIGNFLALMWSI